MEFFPVHYPPIFQPQVLEHTNFWDLEVNRNKILDPSLGLGVG